MSTVPVCPTCGHAARGPDPRAVPLEWGDWVTLARLALSHVAGEAGEPRRRRVVELYRIYQAVGAEFTDGEMAMARRLAGRRRAV